MPAAAGQDVKAWQKAFQELIQEVKPRHQWTLTLDQGLVPNVLPPGWARYQQWAFARFQCSLCCRSWASAQVCVLSHMHWSKTDSQGQVKMRIFAQRCKKCSEPPFEAPEFTEENRSRVLNNLVLRILRSCYREGPKSVEEIPTIKDTTLEGPHDMNNCEACLQGSCAQGGLDLAKQSPASPSLPAINSPHGGIPAYQPSLARSSTAGDAATRNTRAEKGKAFPNPRVSGPPPARSPRNTTWGTDSVIHVSPVRNYGSPMVPSGTPCYSDSGCDLSSICCCNSNACCCLIVLILIVVVWWSFS